MITGMFKNFENLEILMKSSFYAEN